MRHDKTRRTCQAPRNTGRGVPSQRSQGRQSVECRVPSVVGNRTHGPRHARHARHRVTQKRRRRVVHPSAGSWQLGPSDGPDRRTRAASLPSVEGGPGGARVRGRDGARRRVRSVHSIDQPTCQPNLPLLVRQSPVVKRTRTLCTFCTLCTLPASQRTLAPCILSCTLAHTPVLVLSWVRPRCVLRYVLGLAWHNPGMSWRALGFQRWHSCFMPASGGQRR